MLKITLTDTEHATLPDHFKAEYKKSGDSYILDTDKAFEDVTPLKSSLNASREDTRKAKERLAALEAEKVELTGKVSELETRARPASELEKSWKERTDKLTADHKTAVDKLNTDIREMLVGSSANTMAAEIATVPKALLPLIRERLDVEIVDGKHTLVIKDSKGQRSSQTMDELKAEFIANTEFAPIIKASSASGGGAAGGQGGGGGAVPFAKMSEQQRTALYTSNPTEYLRQSDAHKQAVISQQGG